MEYSRFNIRSATIPDLPSVMNIIDGSMLQLDLKIVQSRISSKEVLVAESSETILGILVSTGNTIEVIAVRSKRRDQGIGSALVKTAAKNSNKPLIAEFDKESLQFYQKLGFSISSKTDGRYLGSY
ncbi:MAG TPA: GNAT family N-acetyltransferase [Halobacteriales archaeon]|uniref:GNAT family N-acetyltransferase n=1 Tax=Candidatus Hikarchaeum yamanae TaxID=2675326 RepID=UPI0017D894BB|nr:GNAT family N-acetyltransferase [Halobacteriales archaeon]